MSAELVPVEDAIVLSEERGLLAHSPSVVLVEAQRAAAALHDVIVKKAKPVVMNGEHYLEFEDWQTVGRFYGITAKEDGEPQFVVFGEVSGFKAHGVAVDRDGREISRATAFCLSDEEKWSTRAKYEWRYVLRSGGHSSEDPGKDEIIWEDNPSKPGKSRPKRERVQVGEERVPLFQLASMAQTRANAKALRNVLAWVVVLAGYRPTPAEELDATLQRDRAPGPDEHAPDGNGGDERPDRKAEPQQASEPDGQREAAPAVEGGQPRQEQPRQASGPVPACPKCGNARSVMHSKFKPGQLVCFKGRGGCGEQWAAK